MDPVEFGVPQGSVLEPMLYTAYVAPVGRLIEGYNICFHQYADDTQLYTRLTVPSATAFDCLRQCTEALQRWFWYNGLLLNPDKSVVTYFGTHSRLQKTALPTHVSVAGCDIAVSDKLTVLGVTIDSELTMDQHVNNVVKNCNYHLQALRHIRSSVPRDVANTIACSIIHYRIDYCNSLLLGASGKNIDKLQRVQNRAARIVCGVEHRQSRSSELLRDLH